MSESATSKATRKLTLSGPEWEHILTLESTIIGYTDRHGVRWIRARNADGSPGGLVAYLAGPPPVPAYVIALQNEDERRRRAKAATAPFDIGPLTPVTPDLVNHPPHYKAGGIETIDFIEAKGLDYHLGNVVKYITRAGLKGAEVQDLKKARWYLDRAITRREEDAREAT